jgi:hypothetical protein
MLKAKAATYANLWQGSSCSSASNTLTDSIKIHYLVQQLVVAKLLAHSLLKFKQAKQDCVLAGMNMAREGTQGELLE